MSWTIALCLLAAAALTAAPTKPGWTLTWNDEFDGDKIVHLTKIWNAGLALKDLGWS